MSPCLSTFWQSCILISAPDVTCKSFLGTHLNDIIIHFHSLCGYENHYQPNNSKHEISSDIRSYKRRGFFAIAGCGWLLCTQTILLKSGFIFRFTVELVSESHYYVKLGCCKNHGLYNSSANCTRRTWLFFHDECLGDSDFAYFQLFWTLIGKNYVIVLSSLVENADEKHTINNFRPKKLN